jgi:negative regulator of flagellin synthesis FlgM
MIEDIIFRNFYANANKHIIVENNSRKVEKIEKTKETKNDNIFSKKDDINKNKDKKNNEEHFIMIDTCEISEEAMRLYNLSKTAVDNIPDIRENKVNDIKQRIENGIYNVTAEDLCEKLLKK